MIKKIWINWFQGWDSCPPLCRYCLDSWKHYNPDWEVIELDSSNYEDYVDIMMQELLKLANLANPAQNLKSKSGDWIEVVLCAKLCCQRANPHEFRGRIA